MLIKTFGGLYEAVRMDSFRCLRVAVLMIVVAIDVVDRFQLEAGKADGQERSGLGGGGHRPVTVFDVGRIQSRFGT